MSKEAVKANKLIPFLNQKNHSDVKYKDGSVIERHEVILSKVETLNEAEGTVWCTITTQGTDRTGDIVISSGVDTTEFLKIPSIYINHDYSLLPIAKCEELVHKDGYIMAKMKFVLSVPVIKNIFELVKAGAMKGISIGFAANEVILKGTKAFDDMCKTLGLKVEDYERTGRIISNWSLYEFSLVSIPANADCMVKSLKVEEVDPELIKYLGVKSIPNVVLVKEEIGDYTKEVKTETKAEENKIITTTTETIPNHKETTITEEPIKTVVEAPVEETAKNTEIAKEIKPEPYIIEIKPHVKRYIEVIQTPEEVEEYINKCVEARIRGKTRISII
jgi:hypothetical protein